MDVVNSPAFRAASTACDAFYNFLSFYMDKIVLGLISEKLASPEVANGFILDGFPRNLAQAKALDALLKDKNLPLDAMELLLFLKEKGHNHEDRGTNHLETLLGLVRNRVQLLEGEIKSQGMTIHRQVEDDENIEAQKDDEHEVHAVQQTPLPAERCALFLRWRFIHTRCSSNSTAGSRPA